MALSEGSRLVLFAVLLSILFQTVNPETTYQTSRYDTRDRWQQVSRTSQAQRRDPRQYYNQQRTVSPPSSSADIEYFPGVYRRTQTTWTHNSGEPGAIIGEHSYTHRQRGPIRTTIEHSYTNRRVSSSYDVDSNWSDFVESAFEGKNHAGQRKGCSVQGACYPPTGDLMIGREKKLLASSTCGNNQRYCDHDVSNTTRADSPGLCRQTCSSNRNDPNYFGVENIVKSENSNMDKRWQSEPGKEEVTIQLNLGNEFQFTHLFMTFHTFRPKAMIIEKSTDYGETFKTIAYFAHECAEVFPSIPRGPKRKLTDVICEEKYSKLIPKHSGRVQFSNLMPKEEALKSSNLRELDEIMRVTNLRLKFLKLHKLGDDAIGDSEALKQKYYYAIRSLIIRGTCSCYGHAEECIRDPDEEDVRNMVYSKCKCEHRTTGDHCQECQPLYRDLPWQRGSKDFSSCKSCDCNNYASECVFNETLYVKNGKKSGGQCLNCRNNTAGDNCELCKDFHFKSLGRTLTEESVCQRCECDQRGSRNDGRCLQYDTDDELAGICLCKTNVQGPRCQQCKPGFWKLDANNEDGCEACKCDTRGIIPGTEGCDQKIGKCACKENVIGQSCEACAPGFYGMEEGPIGCKPCDCDRGGSINPDTCDQTTGNCKCKEGIVGRKCDQVEDGYFVPLPDFLIHEAEIPVQKKNTKVVMRAHNAQINMRDFTGVGYMDLSLGGMIELRFPVIPWTGEYNILVRGDIRSHDKELEITLLREHRLIPDGQCRREGAEEEPRDVIKLRTRDSTPVMQTCLEKDTPITIRLESTAPSDSQILVDSVVLVPNYEKIDVYGRGIPADYVSHCINHVERYGTLNMYDQCPRIFFSAGLAVWDRAFKCECGIGTKSNLCDKIGGQCACKMNVVGRQCETCDTTSFGLETHAECQACNCNTEGSRNQFCDSQGKCNCHDDVFGDKCDNCKPGFWGTPRNCKRCECHGRAESCFSKNATCINCRDDTGGEHCERCTDGYYGDPQQNIPCKPCLCPGTSSPGSGGLIQNHATSCTLSSAHEMLCHCKLGYIGEKCEQCDNNYFEDANGDCIPCDCNGKIDKTLEGNCDPVSGKCLRCLYNSEGDQCELCKKGHWKNNNQCQECDCDDVGSTDSYCNQETGECTCHPRVVGDRCSACAEGHYDFNSGKGCRPCNCDVDGTVDGSLTCGQDGQCYCKQGRGGLQCNECSLGFYGDPASGCYRCDCDDKPGAIRGICDARTGHCKCREGMAGPKCDRCARGFKGKAPHCEPCDPCFKGWDLIIQELDERTKQLTETARLIKQTGTSGIHREFNEIENYLSQIKDILAKANIPGLDLSQRQSLLEQLKNLLDTIEAKLEAAEKKHSTAVAESLGLVSSATKLDVDIDELKAKVKKLEEDMTSLQEQNVMGAYNLIKDNLEQAKQYHTKSYAVRGILDNSTELRNEASRLLNRQQSAFKNVYTRNEDLMKELDTDIQNLENTVPQINRHLCASEPSVEGCKDQCGGIGCDECGEKLSCSNAAVRKAKSALEMAKSAETILQTKQMKAGKMRDSIEAARSSANQAHNKALEVHQAVLDANKDAANSLEGLRKLLEEIESLLKKAVGTSGDIRRIADDCMKLKHQLTPQQIEDLSKQIEFTIQSLSNIDGILGATQKDKEDTNDLRNKANRIKDEAQKILNSADTVQRYLNEAARDQTETRTINEQVLRELQNSKSEIADLSERGNAVKERSTSLLTKTLNLTDTLRTLQKNKTEANYKVTNLRKEFDEAQNEANKAHDLSETLSEKYQEAVSEISRKTLSDNAKKEQIDELRQRATQMFNDYKHIVKTLQDIEDFYISYEKKMDNYNKEIARLMNLMDEYQHGIDAKAIEYQVCVLK